jgi:RecB family exonuclease
VLGSAVHKAVQRHFQARLDGQPFGEDEIVEAFRAAWVSEGFLSREHEEQRQRAGEEMLRRFHRADAAAPLHPTAVEEDFAFYAGDTKVVGRYDLVVEDAGRVTLLDFKTGAVDDPKKAQERAAESVQLDLYALAVLRTRGRLPDWVELRFLETGIAGGRQPTVERAEAMEARVREVASAVRARAFPARPSYLACGQCPFRDICPHTARTDDAR